MTRHPLRSKKPPRKRPAIPPEAQGYVGPGHPPKEFRFKPGQSGNPKGRRKALTRTDVKQLIEEALAETVTFQKGGKEHTVTKREAGILQLVNSYAKGDRYARRDLFDLADKMGVNLVAGQGEALQEALEETLAVDDQALLAELIKRHGGTPDWCADDVETTSSEVTETPEDDGRQK
jgi:hypothetical protein